MEPTGTKVATHEVSVNIDHWQFRERQLQINGKACSVHRYFVAGSNSVSVMNVARDKNALTASCFGMPIWPPGRVVLIAAAAEA